MTDTVESPVEAYRQKPTLEHAKALGRGLMRGDRAECKAGYSAENAQLAILDLHELDPDDREQLTVYLAGYAKGLAHDDLDTQDFAEGYRHGWFEDPQRTLPA